MVSVMPQAGSAPTLYPEIHAVAPPPGRGMLGYYRKANGWVVTASTTPANRSHYEYKGHIFLSQYGEFVPDTADPRAQPKGVDMRGVPWNSALEPWRRIFQLSGAKEFPIDQIIAYRWHINPPYQEVTFPQLNDVVITNYECPECDRVLSSLSPGEAAQQLRVHLTCKINDSHAYTPTDLRELGKEWGINFDTRRHQGGANARRAKSDSDSAGGGEREVQRQAAPRRGRRPSEKLPDRNGPEVDWGEEA